MIVRGTEDERLVRQFDKDWAHYAELSAKMTGLAR